MKITIIDKAGNSVEFHDAIETKISEVRMTILTQSSRFIYPVSDIDEIKISEIRTPKID
jgi:hypothetical protein